MGQALKLLQVGDSPEEAEVLRRELILGGHVLDFLRVETPAALEQALRARPWDLVLSDNLLPSFGGGEALRLVQASGRDIPFIVLSGPVGAEFAVAALKAGAHDYLFKDNLARLCPAIERELKEAETRGRQLDAETSLLHTQTLLERAQGMAHIGSWEWTPSQNVLRGSSEIFRIFGVEPPDQLPIYDDFVGRIHPEDRAMVLGSLENVIATGESTALDYRIIRSDGEIRHVHELAEVAPGTPPTLRGTVQDVTERRSAEAELLASKEELDRFFSLVQDLACVGTPEGYLTKVNPVWSKTLGYTEEELMGRPFLEFVHPEDQDSTLNEMALLRAGCDSGRFVHRYLAKDGSLRWFEWHTSPVVGGQVFAVARDITEHRQLEAVREEMEKLSAKGRMAAYIAHEINNPLAGIKNAFSLLEGAIPRDHPHFHYTEHIQREINRIAGIIRTMYLVYRPQTDSVVEVSLLEACQDIRNLLAPASQRAGVDILVDPAHGGLVLFIKPGLLRQLLFNLVRNAVEASPPDGTVTLRLARVPGAIHILVEDRGEGIPPELESRIFEANFTTKVDSDMSGLGLGLSACRSIVESLGGSLDFGPNAQGKGTQFRVCLPETLIFTVG